MKRAKLTTDRKRGSWTAEVNGEQLPCVWDRWLTYDDPGLKPGRPKADKFVERIRSTGSVVLTHGKGKKLRHENYIAVFTVDVPSIRFDGDGLKFRFAAQTAGFAR
jgi:hypothetical protein